MSKPKNDFQRAELLESDNFYLKKEIESLHGKLGAQGAAINREKKYKALDVELKGMYVEVERLEEDKRTLRDDFAAKAMQGLVTTDAYTAERTAEMAYEQADAMMKARDKK